jgi:response regulator RpfG family c-di-GMP phosphodiesterase
MEYRDYPILILDDERDIVQGFRFQFQKDFTIFTAITPDAAFDILGNQSVAVVVSDQRMPKMNGVDFLGAVLKMDSQIVRILLTGYTDMQVAIRAINIAEIFRYVEKPYDSEDMRRTLRMAIEKYVMQRERLEKQKLIFRVNSLFYASITTLTAALDSQTGPDPHHARRVSQLAVHLGLALHLPPTQLGELELAAMFHDIGKLGIPDKILQKQGHLNEPEQQIMNEHPTIGAKILQTIKGLQGLAPVLLHHHECFNGQGYPSGLKGQNIPLYARIITLADSYDLLTSGNPGGHKNAIKELIRQAGDKFDPRLVKLLEQTTKQGLDLDKIPSYYQYCL